MQECNLFNEAGYILPYVLYILSQIVIKLSGYFFLISLLCLKNSFF